VGVRQVRLQLDGPTEVAFGPAKRNDISDVAPCRGAVRANTDSLAVRCAARAIADRLSVGTATRRGFI
jgi:hypothetical protein